jgi:hypothetical protein
VRGSIGGEGSCRSPRVDFIEREGGRGGDDREQWPSMPWRAPVLIAVKGELLNGEETKGEIKEGKTPGPNCTLDGGLKAEGARERRGNGRRRCCCAEQGRGAGGGRSQQVEVGAACR